MAGERKPALGERFRSETQTSNHKKTAVDAKNTKGRIGKALLCLCTLGGRSLQLGAKHPVPESTGDTESIFEISVVVLQVVLLEFLVVQRKAKYC